jgi:hypothetical protein
MDCDGLIHRCKFTAIGRDGLRAELGGFLEFDFGGVAEGVEDAGDKGSYFKGSEHQVTIPAHSPLKVGTLSGILLEIAAYPEISKEVLARAPFG